jgi:hypothetical protein
VYKEWNVERLMINSLYVDVEVMGLDTNYEGHLESKERFAKKNIY